MTTDISSLLLKKVSFDTVNIKELVNQIEAKNKCKNKLPIWYNTPNIYYPNKLNIEQTSSEKTALYKSNIVESNSIIDLTGGFGIDCYYFSKKIKEVTHCEINSELSEIVKHNYKILNCDNIETINTDGINYLKKENKKFDWIYIDPSRRHDLKGKVFLLKDCLPNVSEHIDLLFNNANNILIKTSPLLDIKRTVSDLKHVKEVHIVAIKNEVKELLFVLQKNYTLDTKIHTLNFLNTTTEKFNFTPHKFIASYALPKKYIFEPNSAILKSGAFHEIAEKYEVCKLHQHTHLYTSDNYIDFPGRKFEILESIPYQKKTLKKRFKNKQYNITTRNFPKTVSDIRKELEIKDGGEHYLFFTTNFENKKIVLVCEKLV